MPHPAKVTPDVPVTTLPEKAKKPQGNVRGEMGTDGKVHLVIDPAVTLGKSETGKTWIVAKAIRPIALPGGLFAVVTVYRYDS